VRPHLGAKKSDPLSPAPRLAKRISTAQDRCPGQKPTLPNKRTSIGFHEKSGLKSREPTPPAAGLKGHFGSRCLPSAWPSGPVSSVA